MKNWKAQVCTLFWGICRQLKEEYTKISKKFHVWKSENKSSENQVTSHKKSCDNDMQQNFIFQAVS